MTIIPFPIKEYLHTKEIGEKELNLIKDLVACTDEKLVDLLPTDPKHCNVFISSILSTSLEFHKRHGDLINDIIALKNKDTKDTIYRTLSSCKKGMDMLRANPALLSLDEQDSDKHYNNNLFIDVLTKSSNKKTLDFIRTNKDSIDIELIYTVRNLDLQLIKKLEKDGYEFDTRIINVVNQPRNYERIPELLEYMKRYQEEITTKQWDENIIKILHFLNKENTHWRTKYKFKDGIFLLLELKEPTNYSWGEELQKNLKFSFEELIKENAMEGLRNDDIYIDINNKNKSEVLKKFIRENDIYFTDFRRHQTVVEYFLDDINPEIIKQAIKADWRYLFAFSKYPTELEKDYSFSINNSVYGNLQYIGSRKIFENDNFKQTCLKEYFAQPEYRLRADHEVNFFVILGLNTKKIIEDDVLWQYSDFLTLEDIKYIAEAFKIEPQVIEKQYLERALPNKDVVEKKKLKL